MPTPRLPRSLFSALAVSALGALSALPVTAETSPLIASYDDTSTIVVDTASYSELISALSVSERGRTLIAYDVANARALPFFKQYVDYLSGIPVETLNRDEQLAYWLNTRNILLVQGLSQQKRQSGFKRKRGTPSDPGAFWTEDRIVVSGESLSLQDIEQNILFAGWDDPNIMFGLYQGVEGGPALPRQAFTGANVHAELAEAGRRFTTIPSNFRIRGNKVRISTYFDWYSDFAFKGDEAALRQHLAGFAKDDQKSLVSAEGDLTRKKLSTSFEQYRTRQASTGSGASTSGGVRSTRGGFGS
ncbi:MAG: DUF547 domain-containing protein [Henriciella sp.]|nr:DUF547 domain-containing protein [Henriciella sp.]